MNTKLSFYDISLKEIKKIAQDETLEESTIVQINKVLKYELTVIHLPYDDDDVGFINNPYDNMMDNCKYCGAKNTLMTIMTEGIRVCKNKNCGRENGLLLDRKPEWRGKQTDESSEGMVRCAPLITFHTGGYNKLKTLQNWLSMDHKERSVNKTLADITEKCANAGIKKCAIDDIKSIYKEFVQGSVGEYTSTVRGLNKLELASAITMYACKKRGIPRLPSEIAEIYGLNTSDVTNGCRTFVELMQLKNITYELTNSTPEEYLMRLAPKLGVHPEFLKLAIKIAKNVRIIGMADSNTPPSIASASILLTASIKNIYISVDTVSQLFDISKITSEKTMERIEKYKKWVVDDEKSLLLAKKIAERRELLGEITELI